MDDMDKVFNPAEFEDRIYKMWIEGGYFKPSDTDGEQFVIVIPPPNVTGVLHMGHGLNNSLQDILIRYYRMKGRSTLWVPGTDHAGIATQHVVEKRLREKGISRHDLGREKFLEETWKVKDEHHSIITNQLKKIGSSCDWDRERFTLDEGLSKAVREVFVNLYKKDMIYKGKYLVNWCTSCGTALSDDEVEHEEVNGAFYTIKYPLTDGSDILEIATTRPETMFGDTAVAVNPEDDRYKNYIGKTIRLPLTGRDIPIIADMHVDKEVGTGALKVTPGHDPNDWEIGGRHNLEKINILTEDGKMNKNCPKEIQGLYIKDARKKTVDMLKENDAFIKTAEISHKVGHCYRCSTVIEPYMSTQWFVKMKPMADKALKAWKDGEVNFYPKRWENTYSSWLTNIRDWCISRQLWWGHRIPVWYCQDCDHVNVSSEDITQCEKCESKNIKQDDDVLDTWFSSWLWPFSTLGWPDKTADLARFYPTTSLVTAYDIIFFWVSRMIMAGLEFMGEVPFRDVYITPLVRDKIGRKMSKSLGNGIDPLEIVDKYGADSLKFTIAYLSTQGQDIPVDIDIFKLGSRFSNKIWNASRYILMNIKDINVIDFEDIQLTFIDRWILHQFNKTIEAVDKAVKSYRFDEMTHNVYDFFWNDFCDWYIELSKPSLYSDDITEKTRIVSMLKYLLTQSLCLLHPFLSFITEEIYQKIPGNEGVIITADYPEYNEDYVDNEISLKFESFQEIIKSIRTVRSEFKIGPEKKIPVAITTDSDYKYSSFIEENLNLIANMVNASELTLNQDINISGSIPCSGKGFQGRIIVQDIIDIPAELQKMKKEADKISKLELSTKKKLENSNFLANAPDEVVEKEKSKLEEFRGSLEKINSFIAELSQ